MRILRLSVFAASLCLAAGTAFALTDTGTFDAQIIITDECKFQSSTNMDFGTDGVLDAAINSTSTFDIQCTNNTAYTLSLDDGLGTGTTTTRTMETGGEEVDYTLWKDNARTQNWGDTGLEIMTGLTGDGAVQTYTVYGQVPAQTTPSAGTYTDTITVTVTY